MSKSVNKRIDKEFAETIDRAVMIKGISFTDKTRIYKKKMDDMIEGKKTK